MATPTQTNSEEVLVDGILVQRSRFIGTGAAAGHLLRRTPTRPRRGAQRAIPPARRPTAARAV